MATIYLRETGYHAIVEQHDILARVTGQVVGKFDYDTSAFTNGLDNGMLLKVDFVKQSINAPAGTNSDDASTIWLHYSAEKVNDDRLVGAKNFYLAPPTNAGYTHTMQLSKSVKKAMGLFGVKPLLYKLNVGDSWTSDAFCYSNSEFASNAVFWGAVANAKTTPLYVCTNASGFGEITATATNKTVVAYVVEQNDLPSGQPAVKVVVAK